MTALPTAAQVDRAEPLDFSDGPPVATATLAYRGVLVEVDPFRLTESRLISIEKRIARLLEREGWAAPVAPAPATAPAAPAKPKKQQLPAVERYAPDGSPICPVHNVPMRDSQFGGHYCGEKGGSVPNAKGYCGMKAD